jgi:hypothetical protein
MDKIDWDELSANPNAIHLVEQNMDKVDWWALSMNPNAIHLLEQNMDKVDWWTLSMNPNAIHLLEQNMYKICWSGLSANPNIFERDYMKMAEMRTRIILEELMKSALHPRRIVKFLELGGDMDDF